MNKIEMTPYEKQFYVAYYLNARFMNLPSTSVVPMSADEFDVLPEDEFINILKKFAVDYKVIYMYPDPNELESLIDIDWDDGKTTKGFAIKKEPKFDAFFQELFEVFKDIIEDRKSKTEEADNEVVYWLSFDNGKLLINDTHFLLKKNGDSIPNRVLTYLFENPNRTITRKEFEDKEVLRVKDKEDRCFYGIISDMKVDDKIKKLFFSTNLSKHTLYLKNPIRRKDLLENDVENLNLDEIAKIIK